MRKVIPILAFVAITCWSAGIATANGMDRIDVIPWGPVGFEKDHNLHTGFRNEDAYRAGFNIAWAEACILSGDWDRLQALNKKTKKTLSDKDRNLFEDGEADMAGKKAGDCTTELYAMVIADIEKFIREKGAVTSRPSFLDDMGKPVTKAISVETKLRKLKNLLEKGLITKEVAGEAMREILKNM